MEERIRIERHFFTEKEQTMLEYEGLKVTLFIYESGVEAVRLSGDQGSVVVLPYMGQMIWDAELAGRRLTMGSMFDQPKLTDFFLHTYGCFMMHCGALRMGCPGPQDTHPLHGELPCAPYRDVSVRFGTDERVPYLCITGTYEHDLAFTAHYRAQPEVRMWSGSSLLDISMNIENRSRYPMDLMYMCHINYRPVDHGRIVQSLPWDSDHMVLRTSIPEHVTVSKKFLAFMDRVQADPSLTQVLKPDDEYRPEMAIFMKGLMTDEQGFCHFMQVHPDGTADYVGYRPDLMDHPSRWIMRTGEQEALGIALPSTCDPEGYAAEKKKGHLREVPGDSSLSLKMRTGVLDRSKTAEMEDHITRLL
jgi:hypothetical protein